MPFAARSPTGSDLSKPMSIDFHIAVPSARVGELVTDEAKKLGFKTEVVKDESGGFTTWCTKNTVLTYQAVVDVQSQLKLQFH